MSPQAVADPEEIERFAKNLKQFNEELESLTQRLNGQFSQLSSSWRDQEFQKFEQQFTQTMRTIHSFVRISNEQIPSLHKKAGALRQYLGK
jgi:WXG100 family type VII secretion target